MNPKLQKVNGEIEKTKAKIAESQATLRELEKKKTELENAEIVAIFRKEKLSEDAFTTFVRQMSGHSEAERERPTVEEADNEDRDD